MHSEALKQIATNQDRFRAPRISGITESMEEPVLWLPYYDKDKPVADELKEAGYHLIETFSSEDLIYGKTLSFAKYRTFSDGIQSAAIDGDVAVVTLISGDKIQFRQIWTVRNETALRRFPPY